VSIVMVLLAWTFHLSLVMFRTGSMAPTIPAGSVALVKRIPAGDAQVGQIVTVDRPGRLPITHRVVSVGPGGDGSAVLVLKGDANAVADAPPYRVGTVRLVIWHAPHLARVVVWVSQPVVIGTLTLLVAGLVTWTLWPRRDDSGPDRQATRTAKPAGGEDAG
jgi:signal peptidase